MVFLKSDVFGLALYESSSSVEVQRADGTDVPVEHLTPTHLRWMQRTYTRSTAHHFSTGRLTLRAFAADRSMTWQQEWAEKKPGELPHRFQTIRRILVEAVPAIALMEKACLEAEEREREWAILKAQRDREERERREKEAYKESREQLLAIVDRWALARRIEDFFQDLER